MNLKGISYYLGFFCIPIGFLAFLNILYSSYFNYFLNFDSYVLTLFISFFVGLCLILYGNNSDKKIDFQEQLLLIILIYIFSSVLISIPYYLSNYQIPFVNAIFESISGITGTGFSIFGNIKYLDPTLIIWRSSSHWIGGLYFLIFLILFFSNSQFNYKLNNLVYESQSKLDPEKNFKKISLKIFFIYSSLTFILFTAFSMSGIRLFNSLNLTMTLISNGSFLPTNTLSQIVTSNFQKIILTFGFILSILNIFLAYNIINKKNIIKDHYEDLYLLGFTFVFSLIAFILLKNITFLEILISVLSSISTSGISLNAAPKNFSLCLLLLTVIGGSILSNTSGIKFLRFYILLKASSIEIFKLVKPNNIVNQKILFSMNDINNENIKLSFFVFISFFMSILFLSSVLLLDNISFENSFKLSVLTLTNTASSNLYGLNNIEFNSLLTSSKITLNIFMIIGKIELLSFFLIIKRVFFKN